MPAAPALCASPTPCHEQAARHLARNAAALGVSLSLPSMEFVHGRDGSLTARTNGQWLAGCSVPRRAAELMLRSLSVRGNLACLVNPTHAHQIAVCVERLDASAGLVVVLDDAEKLPPLLACADFADLIAAGRVFFAAAESALRDLFARHPGLPVPQQFIRVAPALGEACDLMTAAAQRVFSEVAARHQQRLAIVHGPDRARPESTAIAVLAPASFRLWNDGGFALASHVDGTHLNPDDPRASAVAHLAEAAARHAALVSVDLARADRPELAPAAQPWIAWITQARVPAYVSTSPADGLVLADESLRAAALRAGWPAKRIAPTAIPVPPIAGTAPRVVSPHIAIIADLPDSAPPESVQEYSSWRLAWETIEHELIENPTRLGTDAAAYLDRALARFDITDKNLPKPLFIDRLIAPSFAIGVAKLLTRENVPLQLHGRGWDRVSASMACVDSREAFTAALSAASAVVDVFVTHALHPIRTCGRPVVRTAGATPARIVQDARLSLTNVAAGSTPTAPTLSAAIAALLR